MRRLARHLFTLCAAASLLLCPAALAVWLGAYSGSPSPVWRETKPLTETRYSIGVSSRGLRFSVIRPSASPSDGRPGTYAFGVGHDPSIPTYVRSPAGGPNIYVGESESVSVRLWLVVLATAVLPLAWVMPRVRARLTVPPGHCKSCRYDLRASPDRCPECGTPAPQ